MLDGQETISLMDRMRTGTQLVRCRCPNGHAFVDEIFVSVNKQSNPEIVDNLAASGVQHLVCPSCPAICSIAEPITINDPHDQRFALFIPDPLTHRERRWRAQITAALATVPLGEIPHYFFDFDLIVGTAGLLDWLGYSQRPPIKQPVTDFSPIEATDSAGSMPASESFRMSTRPAGQAPGDGFPEIHEAFADLYGSKSSPPPPFVEPTPGRQSDASRAVDIDSDNRDSSTDDEAEIPSNAPAKPTMPATSPVKIEQQGRNE